MPAMSRLPEPRFGVTKEAPFLAGSRRAARFADGDVSDLGSLIRIFGTVGECESPFWAFGVNPEAVFVAMLNPRS